MVKSIYLPNSQTTTYFKKSCLYSAIGKKQLKTEITNAGSSSSMGVVLLYSEKKLLINSSMY